MPRVYVSIGSNVERERNLRAAIEALDAHFAPVSVSSVYETEAVGVRAARFLNVVAGFDTGLGFADLVAALRAIEDGSGRERGANPRGAYTLDVDVLTYGDAVGADGTADLPRGEITREAHVLVPLAELAPEARHPVLGERYADLLARLGLERAGMRVVALELRPEGAAVP